MVAQCAHLLLGDDAIAKQKYVDALKSQYLDSGFAATDFEVVYADSKSLTPPKLNEILSYAPSNPSKKRIIFIKEIKSFSKENKNVLLEYLKNPLPSLLLILDAAECKINDSFLKSLDSSVKRVHSKIEKKSNTFDLANAILAHNATTAVRILRILLNNREKPYAILGSLIWKWEKERDQMGLDTFRKGLNLLLQSDVKIKTSRQPQELVLEMLVIRLSSLV